MQERMMTGTQSLLRPFLENQGFLILDGGLASELEHAGFDLKDELWSARLLNEAPDAISEVHRAYLRAGADCIISASYQATIQGFVARGATEDEAEESIQRAVQLACEARDEFWAEGANREGRSKPLVAAGVGPYGAYLANGAEFTGEYDLDEDGLLDFHRRRWHILASSGADLLACETIPSVREARALRRLLSETPESLAWFSFSCRDGHNISDGTPIRECVKELESMPQIVAIGVNCTAPTHISSLVEILNEASDKPVLVYPNSGEDWNAEDKIWFGKNDPDTFAATSQLWFDRGARLVGGCCRTRPDTIRRLRTALTEHAEPNA